jgi:arabinofuranosyltransferase
VCDDGLIVLRTVQNVLDGNGPVFNAGERVEATTSTLWTYVLALGGLQPWLRLEWVAASAGSRSPA